MDVPSCASLMRFRTLFVIKRHEYPLDRQIPFSHFNHSVRMLCAYGHFVFSQLTITMFLYLISRIFRPHNCVSYYIYVYT